MTGPVETLIVVSPRPQCTHRRRFGEHRGSRRNKCFVIPPNQNRNKQTNSL